MTYRKLRIAWSVFWSVAAVLLIVLWVRSYWWVDAVPKLHLATGRGDLYINQPLQLQPGSRSDFRLGLITMTLEGQNIVRVGPPGFVMSLWPITLPLLALAASPWFYLRFSLRTLLIATTLVALVLGLIAWLR